jgi:acetyl-CoA carboxylase carboxyl transferase subunit beta
MSWFKRIKEGITTSTKEKKETPEGLWHKCVECKKVFTTDDWTKNVWTCPNCEHHDRIGSEEYFLLLFDDNVFTELDPNLSSGDPLNFEDTKKYPARLADSQKKTGLKDALRSAHGKVNGNDLVVCCMDFAFIGGSMGSVVGEKIARAAKYCLEKRIPLMIISKSGGARMMEAAHSLMQMAKTSARLAQLDEAGIPFISLLTDPTTGGVTASYAMLGDLNIAEPGSLIGFAGPRVVKETIGKDLPKGFQTAEFVLDHGFLDAIVNRKELKATVSRLLVMFKS